jgi:hypothetical protein
MLLSAPPTIDSSILTVRGVVLDTIISLGSFHPMERDQIYPSHPSKRSIESNSAYGGLQTTREAFWCCIVANITRKGEKCSTSYNWFFTPQIWEASVGVMHTSGFGLGDFFARNKV